MWVISHVVKWKQYIATIYTLNESGLLSITSNRNPNQTGFSENRKLSIHITEKSRCIAFGVGCIQLLWQCQKCLSLSCSAFPCWLHFQARLPQAVAETATSCSGFIYLGSKKRKSPLWFWLSATLMGLDLDYYLKTQVHEPEAQWGQTILKHQSLEQRKVYYRAMQDEWLMS